MTTIVPLFPSKPSKSEGTPLINDELYFSTSTGNKISRQSVLKEPKRIRVQGKSVVFPGAVLRGDLCDINIGEYVFIGEQSVLEPCHKTIRGETVRYPLKIGSFVEIGKGSYISAAIIGSHVSIGSNCTLSARCIVKSCVVIEDNTIIPSDMVIPPLSRVRGSPARIVDTLGDATEEFQTAKLSAKFAAYCS